MLADLVLVAVLWLNAVALFRNAIIFGFSPPSRTFYHTDMLCVFISVWFVNTTVYNRNCLDGVRSRPNFLGQRTACVIGIA